MNISLTTFFKGTQQITKPQAKKLMQLEKEGRLRDVDSSFKTTEVYTPHSGAAEAFESLESWKPVYIASGKSHFAGVQQIKDPGDLDFVETSTPLTEKEEKNLDIRFGGDKKAIEEASKEHLSELDKTGRFRKRDESFHHTEVYSTNAGAGESAEKLRKHKATYVANQSEYSYQSTLAPTQEVHKLEDLLLIPEERAKVDSGLISNWNIAGAGFFKPLSGNGFAAPLVTGKAAILLSENPDLTPAELKEKLIVEGNPTGSKNVMSEIGSAVVNGLKGWGAPFQAGNPEKEGLTLSGTGFAAATVTGKAATMLSENPDLTPAELKEKLIAEGNPTGKGVGIAVLSTGVHPHEDLKGRIVGWKDFVNGKEEPYDDVGQGTHVAGLIAGDGSASGGKYTGIAPEANIIGIKVAGADGKTENEQLASGIQYVIDNKDKLGINVLNMSLGSATPDDGIDALVKKAVDAGITVIAASGSTSGEKMIGAPGDNPASITVGADPFENLPKV